MTLQSKFDHAGLLDFNELEHFTPDEFPAGALDNIEAELVLGLEGYRDLLGHPVVPSPVAGGWFRWDGSTTSRHYAIGRLSDAGDVFPQCDIRDAFLVAMGCPWWGGIGVYLDTTGPSGKPEPMLHLDLRAKRTIWMRHEGRYLYPMNSAKDRAEFWHLLGALQCKQS